MSLVSTLAKVAIGVAVAKGVSTLVQGGAAAPSGGGGSRTPGGGSLQDMMGDLLSGNSGTGGGLGGGLGGGGTTQASTGGGIQGGLGGLLEELAGGAAAGGARPTGGAPSGGGLDDLLEGLGGMLSGAPQQQNAPAGSAAPKGGSLEDLLGGLLGGAGGASGGMAGGGGLGELLGGLLGGAVAGGAAGGTGGGATAAPAPQTERVTQRPAGQIRPTREASFGEVLNQSLGKRGAAPAAKPTPAQNAAAGILLVAMVQAAKSDGRIDAEEKQKLMGQMADATPEEKAFVQRALETTLTTEALVRAIPKGLEQQTYAMSVLAIKLDSQAEARYLDELARGLGLDQRSVNAIHAKMGAPALYS
jgi:uncharacterized membrane protein YebE (DUF533 family)